MIYAAYGSNMSRTRMLGRCPNARFLTKGIAEHFTLQFHYYADAISARNYELPVVLWDIPEDEVHALERAEGYPKHYEKAQLLVCPIPGLSREETAALVGEENCRKGDTGDGIVATAFVMTDWKRTKWERHSEPTEKWYAEHIITGYKENGFDGQHLRGLTDALARGENSPEPRP